jgi:hypothetical protein
VVEKGQLVALKQHETVSLYKDFMNMCLQVPGMQHAVACFYWSRISAEGSDWRGV